MLPTDIPYGDLTVLKIQCVKIDGHSWAQKNLRAKSALGHILQVVERFGADEWNRTITTLRSLEPKSKEIAEPSGAERQTLAFRRNPTAWIRLSITRLGTSLGTGCAQSRIQCVVSNQFLRRDRDYV